MRHILTVVEGLDTPVSLHQRVNDTFTVIYGAEVKAELSYADAARVLGECILHSLACLGKLDVEKPCPCCDGAYTGVEH